MIIKLSTTDSRLVLSATILGNKVRKEVLSQAQDLILKGVTREVKVVNAWGVRLYELVK